MNQQLWRIRHI